MITNAQYVAMSDDERAAWLDSLQGDDYDIVHTPIGRRYTAVMLAVVKRFLTQKVSADCRLEFLQFIERQTDVFSVDALAQLAPIDDEGFEIYDAAMSLGSKGLDVLGRIDIFAALASLNPSLLVALKTPRVVHAANRPQTEIERSF